MICFEQWNIVQIIILTTIENSNFIVVISIHYFREKLIIIMKKMRDHYFTYWTTRFNDAMHSLFAFFDELFSFMMSLKNLSNALSNIEAFAQEKSIVWWMIDKFTHVESKMLTQLQNKCIYEIRIRRIFI